MTQGKGQKDKTYLQIRPAAAVVVIMLLFVVLMANALCIAGALISYYPNMIYPYDCFGWAFAPDTLGLNVNACATDDDAYPWSCMGAGMNGPLSASTSGAIAPVQIVFYLVVAIACATSGGRSTVWCEFRCGTLRRLHLVVVPPFGFTLVVCA